jgi:uncharacterized protein YhfF
MSQSQASAPWWADLPRDRFGDTSALADELIALVLAGKKTATCSALEMAQREDEIMPEVGLLSVIEDGAGRPRCIIETTGVVKKRFYLVDAEFAAAEGEGDGSLAYWRAAHEAYFRRNMDFAPDMLVVCERFIVRELIALDENT